MGKEKDTGVVRVRVNPKYFRPTEVEQLLGDASKAKAKLGWEPKTTLEVRAKNPEQAAGALQGDGGQRLGADASEPHGLSILLVFLFLCDTHFGIASSPPFKSLVA